MSGPKSSSYSVTAEQRRREEEARQARIRQSNAVIDQAFANFSFIADEPEKIIAPETPRLENKFDAREYSARLNSMLIDSRLSAELAAKVAATKRNFESITDSTYRKNFRPEAGIRGRLLYSGRVRKAR